MKKRCLAKTRPNRLLIEDEDEQLLQQQPQHGQSHSQEDLDEINLANWEFTCEDAEQLASMLEDLAPSEDFNLPEENLDLYRTSLLDDWDELEHAQLSKVKKSDRAKQLLKDIFATVPYDSENQMAYVKAIHDIFGQARMAQYGPLINRSITLSIPESNRHEREEMGKVFDRIRKVRVFAILVT